MLNITELTCRVCLEEQNVLINIYDELEELHTNLSKLLETCADLQIIESDIFPKYLCENCTRELLITSKFREKCNKSKEILYELLENSRIIEIEETSANSNDIIEYCADDLSDLVEEDLIIEEESVDKETAEIETIQDVEINEQQESTLSLLRKNVTEKRNEIEINQQLETNIEDTATLDNNSESLPLIEEETETGDIIPIIVSWNDTAVAEAQEAESMLTSSTKAFNEKLKRSHMYKCDICGAIFKQAINLQKHLQKSHDPIHCFTCSKCEHWFSLETEFNKHVENCNYLDINNEVIAENNNQKTAKTAKTPATVYEQDPNRKCVYCERDFPTPFALRMHLRTHTGERPFQCKYCTKSFKTQSQLNVHHKRHTGQADFICTICNKTFYEQSNLTVHMRSHTGERPHVCTVCNKTFTRVFLLQFHMRTHTGEKPYKCTYCDKSFRQHTDLRSHLTIHTGQKQHICILCGKSYIKRSHLVQHMRKHQLHTAADGVETVEAAFYENEPSTEELNTATDNLQNYVQNPEILYNFDEIIESEDVSSQMEESS
ncbi:zinc finger protein 2-like [Lucilia cuprina]|uniref:zinc finger protein 2-like n=1 Tax=Lucilia cuprina TaxID=7375 RepID=UPI001F05A0C4|nr:zinc finger protein 2-like [Lucilia cuprina]